MYNYIYIVRKNKMLLPVGNASLPDQYTVTLLKNLEGLGFGLTKAVIDRIRTMTLEEVDKFFHQFIHELKWMTGRVNASVMYPNFPQQVIDMSDEELYTNALLH